MIMRSFENQIRDSITMVKITAQRLFHLVLYQMFSMYTLKKFAKCFLIFENPFIILKVSFLFSSIPCLFIRAVLIFFVGILIILNGVYDKYFWILF